MAGFGDAHERDRVSGWHKRCPAEASKRSDSIPELIPHMGISAISPTTSINVTMRTKGSGWGNQHTACSQDITAAITKRGPSKGTSNPVGHSTAPAQATQVTAATTAP